MSEQDRDLAQMQDDQHARHRRTQAVIQEVIDGVGRDARGREPGAVATTLVQALAERGVVDQPARWVDAVATELVAGNRYVEDPAAPGQFDERRAGEDDTRRPEGDPR
jgi:hypothetical protein